MPPYRVDFRTDSGRSVAIQTGMSFFFFFFPEQAQNTQMHITTTSQHTTEHKQLLQVSYTVDVAVMGFCWSFLYVYVCVLMHAPI